MKHFSVLATLLFLALGITMTSCNKDDEACATWDGDVQAIVESSCSYSGCHSGGATANSFLAPESADYTSYAAIKANLDNGSFERRVLVSKSMPPAMFVPAGSPTELTQDQLDILQCWADAGFPEN